MGHGRLEQRAESRVVGVVGVDEGVGSVERAWRAWRVGFNGTVLCVGHGRQGRARQGKARQE